MLLASRRYRLTSRGIDSAPFFLRTTREEGIDRQRHDNARHGQHGSCPTLPKREDNQAEHNHHKAQGCERKESVLAPRAFAAVHKAERSSCRDHGNHESQPPSTQLHAVTSSSFTGKHS